MTSGPKRYRLAIDYGTTNSAAAIADLPGLVAEAVRVDGDPTIPSLVVLRPAEGRQALLAGRAAEQSAGAYPGSVAWTPKRELGKGLPVIRAPREVTALEAVAATIELLLRNAKDLRSGTAPGQVVLTHPAKWAGPLQQLLVEAARRAGIGPDVPVGRMSEPVAAALRFHARLAIAPGEFVAVYDLGAGTFDTAILERTNAGFALHGRPGGDDGIGGELFDDILVEHLMAQLDRADATDLRESTEPEWVDARRRFRASVRGAKESLSNNPAGADVIYPRAGHAPLWLTGDELNEQLRPELSKTVELLERTIADAGLQPGQLRSIFLTGGSSKIPLVADLIQQRLGVVGASFDDRKQVVALGAAGAPPEAIEWDRPMVVAPAPAPPGPVPGPPVPIPGPVPGPGPVPMPGPAPGPGPGPGPVPPPPKPTPVLPIVAAIGVIALLLVSVAWVLGSGVGGTPTSEPTLAPPTPTSAVVITDPPTEAPTDVPTDVPTEVPTAVPTEVPPTFAPTRQPAFEPDGNPTVAGAVADNWLLGSVSGRGGVSGCVSGIVAPAAATAGAIAEVSCDTTDTSDVIGTVTYRLYQSRAAMDGWFKDRRSCGDWWFTGSENTIRGVSWCDTLADTLGTNYTWFEWTEDARRIVGTLRVDPSITTDELQAAWNLADIKGSP
jgi:actin-like ATPase involved in cell morphogenesis